MSASPTKSQPSCAHFVTAFGRPPDYVDGHQHVHLFPQVRHAVLDVTRRLSPKAWVRQCGSSLPLHRRLTDPKGLLIDWLSREFRARRTALAFRTNPAFAGTYTYRANADFEQIFPTFLDGMPEGGLIMCHPGFVDAELERLDPLTTLREREYDDRRFSAALADKASRLTRVSQRGASAQITDDLGADLHAGVKVDDILVAHADATGRHHSADGPAHSSHGYSVEPR